MQWRERKSGNFLQLAGRSSPTATRKCARIIHLLERAPHFPRPGGHEGLRTPLPGSFPGCVASWYTHTTMRTCVHLFVCGLHAIGQLRLSNRQFVTKIDHFYVGISPIQGSFLAELLGSEEIQGPWDRRSWQPGAPLGADTLSILLCSHPCVDFSPAELPPVDCHENTTTSYVCSAYLESIDPGSRQGGVSDLYLFRSGETPLF